MMERDDTRTIIKIPPDRAGSVKYTDKFSLKRRLKAPRIWRGPGYFRKRIGYEQRKTFYLLLSNLLEAGLSIVPSIQLVSGNNRGLKAIGHNLSRQLKLGLSLSEAMEACGNKFSSMEIHTIRMGEFTGQLSKVMADLGKFYGRQLIIRRKMTQLLAYPAIVSLVAAGVLYFMLARVVPMFEEVFRQFDAGLPTLTLLIVQLSEFLRSWGLSLFAGCIFFGGLVYHFRRTETFQRSAGLFILYFPLIGKLVLDLQLARFCLVLSTFLQARVKLDVALGLSGQIIRFYPLRETIPEIRKAIINGVSFSQAAGEYKIFPPLFVRMVAAGEQSASMDVLIGKLGTSLEEGAANRIQLLSQLAEPIFILMIGGIVAIILIAMYLPMFQLSQSLP